MQSIEKVEYGGLTGKIGKNHHNFVNGILNYVPFPDLGEFTEFFPGLMRGDVTCFTGTASVSKSALTRALLEHHVIPWAINNKKNLKIIRFGLEESKLQYDYSLLSNRIYKDHGIEYNIRDFECVGRTIKEEHLPLIKASEDKVNRMLKYVDYVDNTYNSFGFWKHVRNFAAGRGKFYKAGKEVSPENDGWDNYVPNDPDEFVIVMVDNLSYVQKQEKEADQREGIWNTVENLRKYAAIKLNYIVNFVQHQDATSENQDSRKDKTILPTENGLAINKSVSRAYLNLIGIANPNKANTAGVDYNIRNWDGHDLKAWNNYLRTLNILKSRWGMTNVHTNVFNAGRSGYFSKIPKTGTPEYTQFVKDLKNFQ